jgi:hypothetical protein
MKPAKDALVLTEDKKNQSKRKEAPSFPPQYPLSSKMFRPATEGVTIDTLAVDVGKDFTVLPIVRPESESDGMYYFNIMRKGPIETDIS